MNHDASSPLTETPSTLEARLQALEAQVLHLQAALNQAHTLFQASPAAAFLLTPQGRIVDVNARGAALLGSSREELLGRRFSQALAASSQASFAALLARVGEGQGRQTGEVQLLTPGGEVLELALEAVPHVREGEPPCIHLTLTDVTAFKLAHRALWEAQLQDQARTLRQLQEEFERVVLTSGRELEGTLTRAASFLALLQRHPETPDHLTHAQEALRQTQGLLESLRLYMQVRFLRVRMRRVELDRVLREVLKDLGDELARRDVRVTSAPLPTVYGDSQVLQIILHEYVIATHANSRALLPGNRHLTDAMARAVAAAGGVIGLVFLGTFIRAGWDVGQPRVALEELAAHARHYAALVGWEHVGLGTDLDGGFGREKTPAGIERYRDVPRFLELLPEKHRAGVAGGNWARWLTRYL